VPSGRAAKARLNLPVPQMTRIEENIRDYIESSFLDNGHAASGELSIESDLLTILDSLQILRMLLDLESQYSIKVDNSELTPDNLGTIKRLAEFIDRKQQEAVCKGPSS
jgi:acyl carrier protein